MEGLGEGLFGVFGTDLERIRSLFALDDNVGGLIRVRELQNGLRRGDVVGEKP